MKFWLAENGTVLFKEILALADVTAKIEMK
jgi:hypothetical protein